MWTLPEGLLAAGTRVYTRSLDSSTTISRTKVEMTASFWVDKATHRDSLQPCRLLAEHYTGTLSLTRLQLFSTALVALGHRSVRMGQSQHGPELAYALMGLLSYRIAPAYKPESLFQSIARLSLHNDSDRLIERLVCLLPFHHSETAVDEDSSDRSSYHLFMSLAQKDQYETQLWDIDPLCQVVGLGAGSTTVFLDGCRAVPIQWNKFPRLWVKTQDGDAGDVRKKRCASIAEKQAELLLSATSVGFQSILYSTSDFTSLATYIWLALSHVLAITLFFQMRPLFGGAKVITPPKLVAFEGTMPISELEKRMLGFDNKRLSYEPSATPFFSRASTPRRAHRRRATLGEESQRSLSSEIGPWSPTVHAC
jgi:hypothetical protein